MTSALSGQADIHERQRTETAKADERYRQALLMLVTAYPIGTTVRFRTYHPTIWPRDWRRLAERAMWGSGAVTVLKWWATGPRGAFPRACSCAASPMASLRSCSHPNSCRR
jgi:hypothetical protein